MRESGALLHERVHRGSGAYALEDVRGGATGGIRRSTRHGGSCGNLETGGALRKTLAGK
jgi:hypothetical protein